jgi:hypothetical protein
MKYISPAYINGKHENIIITDEDLKIYPRKYKPYTMYCSADDITIVWAIEILVTPRGDVEINRKIINFVYGPPNSSDSKRILKDYRDNGTVNIYQPLILKRSI